MEKTLLGGRYVLRELLGSGGMAKAYLAHDEVLDRDIALKVLREQYAENDEFVERFRREARSAAALSHPNVVSIYDRGEFEDGTYYIAMEYLPGGTLKDRILERGTLPSSTVVEVANQVAEALRAAHEKGVVHRDIKPQNVLVTENGAMKVADFGIARAAAATTISRTSVVLGTVTYMAPEQAMGEPASPRSDLYSLGVVLYEMLTGEVPFKAETPVAISMKHVNEPPRALRELNSEIPEGIEVLTMKLLSKAPQDRHQSADALLADLARIEEGTPVAAADGADAPVVVPTLAPPGGEGEGRRGPRRGKLARAAVPLAVLLLLLALLGAYAWSSWNEDSEAALSEAPREAVEAAEEAVGPARAEVPDLSELGPTEAKRTLEEAGLRFGGVEEAPSNSAWAGYVTGQDPAPDTEVKPGTYVYLTVGSGPEESGPEPVSVPDVSYAGSVEEAERLLKEAGCEVAGTRKEASTEPAGTVIGTDPPAETNVESGTKVTIVVSSGPPPPLTRSVPPGTPSQGSQVPASAAAPALAQRAAPLPSAPAAAPAPAPAPAPAAAPAPPSREDDGRDGRGKDRMATEDRTATETDRR